MTNPLLAILTPTIREDAIFLARLESVLLPQLQGTDTIWIQDAGDGTIGEKRNRLVEKAANAGARYVCHFDSDDLPYDGYVSELLRGCRSGADCVGFRQIRTVGGVAHSEATYSLANHSWRAGPLRDGRFQLLRLPCHLTPIKTSIVRAMPFPPTSNGEDVAFALKLQRAGMLRTEWFIDKVLYEYQIRAKGNPPEESCQS